MKKLFVCISLCLMMIVCACGNSEQVRVEKQKVSEILTPYNGSVVIGKSKLVTRKGSICTLQLSRTDDGVRYIYNIDSLPQWVWYKYDLDDIIDIEIPHVQKSGD